MKINNIILIILLVFCSNCKSQINTNEQYIIIELSNVSYGKIPPKYDKVLLSKITKNDSRNFSSAIGGQVGNEIVDCPINDKVFNHEFFNNFDYDLKRTIKLYIKKYIFKNKEYLIAVKVE